MKDILRLKVETALQEGCSHLMRLESSAARLAGIFPLTATTLASLAEMDVSILDQYIYRFTKLQDAMGTRLFPALVSMITGDDEPRPFLDTLNQLEKAGIVSSVETWQTLRVLRNNLAHDYPDSGEQSAATLNMLFSQWRQLAAMYDHAKTYYQKKLAPLIP